MILDVYPESGFFSIPAPDPRSRGQKSPEPRVPGLGPENILHEIFPYSLCSEKVGMAILSFC